MSKHPDQYLMDIKSIIILKDKMSKLPKSNPPATELHKYRKFRQIKLNKNEY